MERRRSFRILQDGLVVASIEGPESQARNTMLLYQAQYAEDGQTEVQEKISKRWKTIYKTQINHD